MLASQKGEMATKELLAFFAVGDAPQAMQLTMRNVDHLRTAYHGRVDVFLAHYGNMSAWPPTWYRENVDFSISSSGYKMQLLQKSLRRHDQIDEYMWVWALDEDIDITRVNVRQMLGLLKASKALIAGPSIVFPAAAHNRSSLRLFNASAGSSGVLNASLGPRHLLNDSAPASGGALEESGCQPGDRRCSLQAPRKECSYRYTNIVENTAPLFRPVALWHILHECADCLHEGSSWGLMDIWCGMSTRRFADRLVEQLAPEKSACVVLDEATVVHRNYRTLGKYTDSGAESGDVRRLYKREKLDLQRHHARDFVRPEDFKTLHCVRRNASKAAL